MSICAGSSGSLTLKLLMKLAESIQFLFECSLEGTHTQNVWSWLKIVFTLTYKITTNHCPTTAVEFRYLEQVIFKTYKIFDPDVTVTQQSLNLDDSASGNLDSSPRYLPHLAVDAPRGWKFRRPRWKWHLPHHNELAEVVALVLDGLLVSKLQTCFGGFSILHREH